MKTFGYVRISTKDQKPDRQLDAFKERGIAEKHKPRNFFKKLQPKFYYMLSTSSIYNHLWAFYVLSMEAHQ